MFRIGDLVVHPMHGAGVIDNIVQERVAGTTQEYYVFKMPMGGLLLKIPVANSGAIGVRGIISPEEAEALLSDIPNLTVEVNSNWNKRYQENMMRLKSGDLYEVARVVKALMHRENLRGLSTGERKMHRENLRGLSTGERKMLHNAKQILISEIVLTEHAEYGEVEDRVDRAMMQLPVS